jgi:hypothetical protein
MGLWLSQGKIERSTFLERSTFYVMHQQLASLWYLDALALLSGGAQP